MATSYTRGAAEQRRMDQATSFQTKLRIYMRDPNTPRESQEESEGLRDELQEFTRRMGEVPAEYRPALQRLMAEKLYSTVLHLNVLIGQVLQGEGDPLAVIPGLREEVDRIFNETFGR
jgi:hypothetical protein